MLTLQPSDQDKGERKTAFSTTMTKLLERFKALDGCVVDRANETLPNLVSLKSDVCVFHLVEENFWSAGNLN